MSRQQPMAHSDSQKGSSASNSPTGAPDANASPLSSASPNRVSEASDGYPSWLPKRPPPPAPASTFHSSAPSEPFMLGGRKPTPRSIRIVSMPGSRREPTDQTRVPSGPIHTRAWSKATGAGVSPTVYGSAGILQMPKPRFRASAMHPELVQSPSVRARIQFYLLPLFVFAHIPLQTYFDFNAVFMMFQVSKFPNPEAPGVPGSGRNWALGAAAYIACWAAWILVVTVVYEFVYSFLRRWRVKRPTVFPLYLSSPAYNFVSMTSYTNFCFMRQIRRSAFSSEHGGIRDGIAETCWFYSQNMPTVALLLPRAGLSLALLLSFSSPQPTYVALADAGDGMRDNTFFRGDGTLSSYARGVLYANAAWTAWRTLVLICSWIGIWVLSGQACAGLCGPRYRWEEEEAEKRASTYSDNASQIDAVPWNWREGTQLRVQAVYDFCLTVRPSARWGAAKKEASDAGFGEMPRVMSAPAFEGMEQVMAAVGFPASPPPARRGVLSDDLFESPKDELSGGTPEFADIIPKATKRFSKDKEKNMAGPSGPLMTLPYPFTGYKAQLSSENQVPFPPSPDPDGEQGFSTGSDAEVEGEEEEEELAVGDTEDPSSISQGRTSGSMSSLGQAISSRYPFQFRRPARGTNSASSSAAQSHISPQSLTHSQPSTNSRSTNSRSTNSRSTNSTGTHGGYSADLGSPLSATNIPMPPRHPQPRGRARAGTVPSPSPTPVVFPRAIGRPRASTRADSSSTDGFAPEPQPGDDGEYSDDEELIESPVPEGAQETAEEEDSVGLLSAGTSPRTSLVGLTHRPSSNVSSRRSRGSRTDSHKSGSSSSRSRAGSAVGSAARSRAQSLIQSLGAASRSSLELVQAVRSRTHSSMARLEEDMSYHSDTRSGTTSGSNSVNENYTFGLPMMAPRESAEDRVEDHVEELPVSRAESESPDMYSPPASPHFSVTAPSEHPSQRTVSPSRLGEPQQPVYGEESSLEPSLSSRPDISTAAASFVTAAATLEGTSGSSERSASTYADVRRIRVQHLSNPSDGTWGPA